ncbi:transmembrane domain-containing protein TMIGD3 [Tachysurus fulvidraco]|uniref:transmembrane domain-containing protein TMIGD3 n=1 Tax=Tachysurus fulvidraco TaxID=1234273 RepID=UPI001FEDDE42|nr:transmembrane domain-containing protein TMIGD3 [Tachysurus fulvidraco]
MFLLTSTLIFISAVMFQCHAEQTLVCPYNSNNKNLQRVWCKRDTTDTKCCTGLSFMPGNMELENGHLDVTDNGTAFTVSVTSLPQGDGVYWCGLKNGSYIIRLAEKELRNSMDFIWAILRYLLFSLLLVAVISTHVFCSWRKPKE